MATNNNTDMFAEFFSTVFKFLCKMFFWALWAAFRIVELISGGVASWIKNTLTQ